MDFALPAPGSAGYIALCAGAWMTGASAAAYVAFGLDRRRAARGLAGVPETTLLWLAGLGGSPGAKIAEWRMRHRRRRSTFAGALNAICLMQMVLVVMLLLPAGSLKAAAEFATAVVTGREVTAEDRPGPRRFGPMDAQAGTGRGYICRADSC